MKKTFNRFRFWHRYQAAALILIYLAIAPALRAYTLDSSTISGRVFRGISADNNKISCSVELNSIRKSPSNKRFRTVSFNLNNNETRLIDFDPKSQLMPLHYNTQAWFGYEIWFRNYGDDSHSLRIWMNYYLSPNLPVSLQLFSESKKTGVKRLIADCVNLK